MRECRKRRSGEPLGAMIELDVAVRASGGNETLVIYSDNGTVEGVGCGSRGETTVGDNYDDDDSQR